MTRSIPALLLALWAVPAFAAQPPAGTPTAISAVPAPSAQWKEECGSCHLPYPAHLLPAESWRAVMAGLKTHFGVSATLDQPTASAIERFLVANASMRPVRSTVAGSGPVLRITETPWFLKEHRGIPAGRWTSPQVKSKANCAACHTGAERGNFDDEQSGSGGGRR